MATDNSIISNRLLAIIIAGSTVVSMLCWILWPDSAQSLSRSGDPLLLTLALIGSLLLIGSVLSACAKRGGRASRFFYRLHVWLAASGFLLVAIHSKGSLSRPPALLLAILLGLMLLGYWSRTHGASAMAATFGTKRAGFLPPDEKTRQRLRDIIRHKQQLLTVIDESATEALFSLTPTHWLKNPRAALAYQRAVTHEHSLTGLRQSVNPLQAYWRLLHQFLSIAFVAGLLLHIILVLFFAGYVAGDDEIYWWHIFAWRF